MPNYQVISRQHYGHKRWLRYNSYAHAADSVLMPVTLSELPKVVLSLPMLFSRAGDGFSINALMNLAPGKNLLVAPGGQWVGRYVPAGFRAYPFILGNMPDGETVLCIDEDSGLVSDGPEGEPFFDEEGLPSKAIQDVLGFLNACQAQGNATLAACAALAKFELIQPLEINLQGEDGVQKVTGLFRVDEERLNGLGAEALAEVRNAGGLAVAYTQLLSMQHLSGLAELLKVNAQAAQKDVAAPLPKEIDLEFLNKDASLSFKGF